MGLSFGSRSKLWLTVPNPIEAPSATGKGIINPTPLNPSSAGGAPIKPKVEYLATLDKHGATVNVVRFSPSGNILATAGDDGAILLWKFVQLGINNSAFSSSSDKDNAYDRETWKEFKRIGARAKEIYDICWSPDGQFILAGGTDNAARIFRVITGECVCELYDHKDWVQGVAWDPLNKFIATQSKDRTMNIYSIETSTPKDPRDAIVSCKLLSKNIKLHVELPLTAQNGQPTSTTAASSSSHLMYGDEETTPFFRRLAFSPDGAILVSPAGIYDSAKLSRKPDSASSEVAAVTEAPISADKDKEKEKKDKKSTKKAGPGPTSFLFARGQLANESPFAHLPGHRTASVVVKFNPVLWELRKPSVEGKGKGKEREAPEADRMEVDGQENRESAVLDIAGSGEATSAIKLSQRNIYAVATHDTILIYDTQQTAPIAFFSSLHFAAFTDLAWTSDGLTLIATSQDGYASLFTFDEGELGSPCTNQPERLISPLEQTDLFNATSSSPVKQLEVNGRVNGAPHSASSSSKPKAVQEIFSSPVKNDDSDIIMLDGPPSSAVKGSNGEEAGSEKKVKKRAALTTLPLS